MLIEPDNVYTVEWYDIGVIRSLTLVADNWKITAVTKVYSYKIVNNYFLLNS